MDFYEYLGLEQTATQEEIRKSFRKLAKQKHPDHNKKESAFWEMVELNVIKDTLLNEEKRREYDKSLQTGQVNYHYPTPQPSYRHGKRHQVYKTVKSFFSYRCRVCGLEMKSTWQGYCLLHYLEATDQIDNPDFIFQYNGQTYKWADPPDYLRNRDSQKKEKPEAVITLKPWHIAAYTVFIIVISACIMLMALMFIKK